MRLTVYTDYALRVMMYLAIKHKGGELCTIDDIAGAYRISRAHVAKIVNDLGVHGLIHTVRGRMGGIRLVRPPEQIAIGEIVRISEEDFAIVACHEAGADPDCAILPACNLKRGLQRAIDAFMFELDKMTLGDSVSSLSVAAGALGIDIRPVPVSMPKSLKGAASVVPPAQAPGVRKSAVARKTTG